MKKTVRVILFIFLFLLTAKSNEVFADQSYCAGSYRCAPYNSSTGLCDTSLTSGSNISCILATQTVCADYGQSICTGGCVYNDTCSWYSCTSVDGGWSSYSGCYSNGSICIKDRACDSPVPFCGGADCVGANWAYCTGSEVGCYDQACPTYCGYGGGSVNDGGVSGSCGCTTKSCRATAPCCAPTNPDAPVLSSPASATQVRVNQAVSLGWGAISNWGTGCPTNSNRYEVCVMSGSTCDLVNYVSAGTNTTYSWTPTAADNVVTWKVRSNNGSNTNESGTRTVCVEGGLTYGAWSACNASTHKRTRTCTETCGTDDCTAAGAVGGVITQDCVGTIQGALFDASDMTTCPADLISNPGNYSGVLIANRSFNMTSPFGPPSWPGVNAATRTLTTNANGFYTLNAYAPGTYTYDFSALAGTYIPVPRFNCTSAAAGLPGCSSADMSQPCATASLPNMSFGFWRIYGGWWQATGGNVYAKNGLGSAIPASVPAANQRLILSDSFGRSGMLSHGFAWAGTELGTNPNASVSTPLWRIQSTYNGLRYDFDYYQTRMDVFESTAWDGGAINYDDLGVGYQIFKHTGDVTLGYSGPTGTQKAVLLIDGNVTINNDITVPDGAFLGVVASGNITINPNVTTAQGWFVGRNINFPCSDDAAPLGTCDTDDVQFVGEGSFVGWTTINLDRDMGVGNNSAPSESFRYRPDMYLNVPDPMKVYTKRFTPFIP